VYCRGQRFKSGRIRGFAGYEHDLFLTQNVEVGVIAGTRMDDGGRVLGKIVGVTGGRIAGEKQRGTCDILPSYEIGIPQRSSWLPGAQRPRPAKLPSPRTADAKETAIVCPSAALVLASFAALALTSER
jgi:hypothetical protein